MANRNNDIGSQINELIKEINGSPEVAELKNSIRETTRMTIESVKAQFGTNGINRTWSETYTYSTDGELKSGNVSKGSAGGNGGQPGAPGQSGSNFSNYPSSVQKYINMNQKNRSTSLTKSNNNYYGTKLPVIRRPHGKASGSALVTVGTGASTLGISGGMIAAVGAALQLSSAAITTGLGLVALLPLGMYWLAKGSRKLGRADRFQKYVEALSAKTFCSIRDLASIVKKSEKYVIRDLEEMCRDRWFYEGHMDENKTCFIATDASYNQYLLAEQSRRDKEKQEQEAKEAKYIAHPELKEIEDTIREGNNYLKQLRAANEEIPGAEMTEKIDRMELVCSKIFVHLEKHPEKLPDLRKFMKYYLPTALKLVNSYKEFDKLDVQGDNIKNAKKEIEDSIDGINRAFENQFDQLFADDAMDVSTDISVLKTMLAQEGLMGDDMGKTVDVDPSELKPV